MNNDLLRSFVAVAETEGFSAAAGLLNRTQSAVSLQIKRLEEELGVSLFARTSRSVALTKHGVRLLPYARQLLLLEQAARDDLKADRNIEKIRFGLPEEHAAAYLPAFLPTVAAEHANLQVEIVCDVSSALIAKFQDGLLDVVLAVRHGPTKTGRLLGLERMIWVAGPGFTTPQDAPLPLALNPTGCIFRDHATAALGKMHRSWREPFVSTSPTGINQAVRSGLAMTVKTRRSVPPDCEDIGQKLDLPELGQIEIELHVSPSLIGSIHDSFVGTLEALVRSSNAVTAVP